MGLTHTWYLPNYLPLLCTLSTQANKMIYLFFPQSLDELDDDDTGEKDRQEEEELVQANTFQNEAMTADPATGHLMVRRDATEGSLHPNTRFNCRYRLWEDFSCTLCVAQIDAAVLPSWGTVALLSRRCVESCNDAEKLTKGVFLCVSSSQLKAKKKIALKCCESFERKYWVYKERYVF